MADGSRVNAIWYNGRVMLLMILIDLVILLAIGVPIAVLHRKWRAWVDREPLAAWPFDRPRRFGLRSWAARGLVLDSPVEQVKDLIDDLPEMDYAEAATLIAARGRSASGNFMALAPLTGRQVFETGIETEWLSSETVELRTHAYADWPINPLDEAQLPAKQHQMAFEHALVHVERHGERRTRVSYELQTPVWVYLLHAAVVLLVGWALWMALRALGPDSRIERINLAVMAVLIAWTLASVTSVMRLQSIGLMDSVIRSFGAPVPRDHSDP